MTFLPRNNLLAAFFIFCGGLCVFTIALSHQEIIGFESRFYLFALTMWRHGATWFPTISGAPYPDYPATSTLLIYGLAKLTGHMDKWTAVFPSAVASAVTLAVTYLTGALYQRRWGWLAVCFLLLTNTFLTEARTISPDQYIAMVTVLVFYLLASAQLVNQSGRLIFVPLLLLFGFACRGPIGLVIPAGVWCVFYLVDKDYRKFFLASFVSAGLLVLGCGVLYYLALQAGGVVFAHSVFESQVSGRMTVSSLPWYFYFSESFGAYALTYPLAGLMLLAAVGDFKNWQRQGFLWKLAGWVVVILVGMSIPAGKKIRYILAMAPALALLCAYLLSEPQQQKYLRKLRSVIFWFCCFFPLVCFAGALLVEVKALQNHWQLGIYFPLIFAMFLLLQMGCWWQKKNVDVVMGLAALSFVLAYVLLIEPINLVLNHTREFVQRVEALRKIEHAPLCFYQENPDGLPIKYLVDMPQEDQVCFIETPAQLAASARGAYFIASPEHFARLSPDVLAGVMIVTTGKLGHDGVVVFRRR